MLIFHEYKMQNVMKAASDQITDGATDPRAEKIARPFPMTLYFSTASKLGKFTLNQPERNRVLQAYWSEWNLTLYSLFHYFLFF